MKKFCTTKSNIWVQGSPISKLLATQIFNVEVVQVLENNWKDLNAVAAKKKWFCSSDSVILSNLMNVPKRDWYT
jgi:hypothetical protein